MLLLPLDSVTVLSTRMLYGKSVSGGMAGCSARSAKLPVLQHGVQVLFMDSGVVANRWDGSKQVGMVANRWW